VSTITVKRVLSNQDFRGYKKMLGIALRHLNFNEAIICFNRKHTRARLIDAEGGIYNMPSPPEGQLFDVHVVHGWINTGLGVILELPNTATPSRKKAA